MFTTGEASKAPGETDGEVFRRAYLCPNWGTRHLMLRLPRGGVDEDALALYVIDDVLDFWTTDEHLIIQWLRNEEPDEDWVEGKAWMARLLPLRDQLRQGDYRALYLGWLYGASVGNVTEDETECPCPQVTLTNGRAARTGRVFGIDEDLFAAASLTSPPPPARADSERKMAQWLSKIPVDESRRYLLLLLEGKARQAEQQIQHAMPCPCAPPSQRKQFQLKRADRCRIAGACRTSPYRTANVKKKRERELTTTPKSASDIWSRRLRTLSSTGRKSTTWLNSEPPSAYDRARDLIADCPSAASLTQRRDRPMAKPQLVLRTLCSTKRSPTETGHGTAHTEPKAG